MEKPLRNMMVRMFVIAALGAGASLGCGDDEMGEGPLASAAQITAACEHFCVCEEADDDQKCIDACESAWDQVPPSVECTDCTSAADCGDGSACDSECA